MDSHIQNQIRSLPEVPGIYKYFDSQNNLIYIGKAKNLRKRVKSYFTKGHQENRKTAVLVSRIADIQITVVETEMDALLLENALIKKHQPRYNVSLKDDKTYASICIKNERFPRVINTRILEKNSGEYFGPYSNGTMRITLLELIRATYPLRTCNLHLGEAQIKAGKYKACLEYDMGNCKAPCVGKQSEAEYLEDIASVRSLLKGRLSEVKAALKQRMQHFASQMAFEEAELLRQKIVLLENYQSKSTIVNGIRHDVDVFSLVSDSQFGFVNYLKVSNGIIVQTQTFEMKKKLDEGDEELLGLAIAEVRDKYQSQSTEIIIPMPIELKDEGFTLTVPKTGDKKKLLDLSLKNALYYKRDKLNQYELLNPELKTERILSQMMNDLRLKNLPRYIECFDNSNLQGTNPVSACVVFRDAKPSKKEYRHFIPTTVTGPDDFATMREVVLRRYKRLLEENHLLPDLILIDGGKGQLSSAIESLKALGIYGKIPVLGIAKRLEELYYPEDELPLFLDKKSETLKILQQLRDEAHRFGITHHRKRRNKNTLVTELENIPGIGQGSAKQLLLELKSVKKAKEATLEILCSILGTSKGTLVFNYFHVTKD